MKKKQRDHRTEVAALAAVVRVAFEELASEREVPEAATAALSVVERWLGGEAVDAAALQAAADRSREEGVRFAQREKDRARGWARAAAGNLAWLAKQDRGWQQGVDSTLDAAVYTLSSLGGDGAALTKRFKQLYASAPTLSRQDGKAASPRPRNARPKRFKAWLGAAADRAIESREPTVESSRVGSPEALRALLAQRHYAVHDAALAFDERYGGLVIADEPGAAGEDWLFGAYACLTSDAHLDPRGDRPSWIPVAYSPNDCIYFLDEQGVAWCRDTIADTHAERFAADGDAMMRRIFTKRR